MAIKMIDPGVETRPRTLIRVSEHRLNVTAATLRAQVEPHAPQDVLRAAEVSTRQLSEAGRQSLLQLLFAR